MIKRNLIANFLGQGWAALMGLAFIPVYIKYLGIEAYGLIGLFAVLQAWLTLLDVGMTPTLGREMARFTGGAITVQQLRDLLRSIEVLTFALVATVALVAIISANWIATNWLNPDTLSSDVVAQAFAVMGLAVALKFAEGIYRSSLVGLQHQVLFNAINASMATLRALGAVAVLVFISPDIQSFFLWQAGVSVLAVVLMAAATYKVIPSTDQRAKFSIESLQEVWRFAAGMAGITFLALLLTQIDKVLLSNLLTLEEFGFYSLATAVAASLFVVVAPITQAFYPRFCELVTSGEVNKLSRAYHKAALLVSVLAGSLAMVLIVNAEMFLQLWTQNTGLASQSGPLLSLLMLGNLFNCLMWVPYQTQLAFGWTGLTVRLNLLAVLILVPSIFMLVPRHGPIAAAAIWVALNAGYVFFGAQLMFKQILKSQKATWYVRDLLVPLAVGALCALAASTVISPTAGWVMKSVYLLGSLLVCLLATCGAALLVQSKMREGV